MGYPMRWEDIAAPEVQEQRIEERVERTALLSRHFRRLIAVTLAGCIVLVLGVMGVSSCFLSSREAPELRPEPSAPMASVALSKPHAVRRVGYVSVTGQVDNKSVKPLNRVEVVVNLLDREHAILRTQTAMVTREPIAPGQASTYQVSMPDDSHAISYRVHLRNLYGAELK